MYITSHMVGRPTNNVNRKRTRADVSN